MVVTKHRLGEVAQTQGWILQQLEYLVAKEPGNPHFVELQARYAVVDQTLDELMTIVRDLQAKIERAKIDLT